MDVTSLYTNIPPPPIPNRLLEKALKLFLKENPSQFDGHSYLQTHGAPQVPKRQQLWQISSWLKSRCKSQIRALVWKAFIDDLISLLHTNRYVVNHFSEQANNHHPPIKFTGETSVSEATFLDSTIYKGERFIRVSVSTREPISNQQRHSCKFYTVSPTRSTERLH